MHKHTESKPGDFLVAGAGCGEPAIRAGEPHQSGLFANDAVRKCLKNRNLSQMVARIAHGPAGLIVGAGLVSAQIRAGTRPAPTRMANRATMFEHSRILRQFRFASLTTCCVS
jgi:hypothetical protein